MKTTTTIKIKCGETEYSFTPKDARIVLAELQKILGGEPEFPKFYTPLPPYDDNLPARPNPTFPYSVPWKIPKGPTCGGPTATVKLKRKDLTCGADQMPGTDPA